MKGWTNRGLAASVALAGAALAWVASGPRTLVDINWDQGAYIAAVATGRLTWSNPPWNAHFAIGGIYVVGCRLTRALGGTVIDGFRATNALFFAVASGFVADAARRLSRRRAVGAALGLVWMAAWVNVFFMVTLEDNVLYLAPAAALLWVCVLRVDRWSWHESVLGGALAAFAALQSWQAIFYIGPPFYAALVGGRRREWYLRAAETALVPAAFAAALVAWCALVAATSPLALRALTASLFTRPEGRVAFHPLSDWASHTRIIGRVAGLYWKHTAFEDPAVPLALPTLGWLVLGLVAAALVVATAWWLRGGRGRAPHLLAVSLAAFTLATPLYDDVEHRYLLRFDFWPLMGVLLLACALGAVRARWVGRVATVALAALFLFELHAGLSWARHARAGKGSLPSYLELPHPGNAWYGREGKSWFAYFRGVREGAPHACRYVLALAEVWEGSWNFDIPASLWSELPQHVALGLPAQASRWRDPPRVVTVEEARQSRLAEGCAWVSRDAQRLLAGAPLPR